MVKMLSTDGVVHVAESGERPDPRHVDVAVDDHGIVDVDIDDFADDQRVGRSSCRLDGTRSTVLL